MQGRAVAVLAVAMVWAAGLGLAQTTPAAGAGRAVPEGVPNVFGDGIPLAFSGLDGNTSAAAPCVARTLGNGVVLKFHLPRDPVLRVILAGDAKPQWQIVTNDLLAAKVPGDVVPMVVGFVSANVVVGRLPQGARVSLTGGGSGVVLLREAVGDRTQFAFAYDPGGAATAAGAASQALKVSIETLVETRLDFFAAAPKGPEGTRPRRAMTLAKALSVLKVNTYAPQPPIAVRWTTPARWPHQFMDVWGSAFHSLGLMHLDLRLAKQALEAVYGCQGEDGFIPRQMGPGQTVDDSHPPILGWAAWQVYAHDKMRDREFLKRSFDASQKHVTWFMKQRRLDGEPPPEKALEHGTPLYFWKSAEESGTENSPRFDGGAEFAAIDLSCYLVNECRALQAMAQQLGFRELAKTWGTRAEAIAAAARKTLWNGERKFFFDRKGDGEWIDVRTWAGLLPLWSGLASDDQAAILQKHLTGEAFWTPAGVATVARDDPTFKKDMWRGPVWVQVNYLMIRALQARGAVKEAEDLRTRTLEVVEKWYQKTGAFWEFYDPDDQTPPPQLARKSDAASATPVTADLDATAALYVDLLLRPKP